MQASHSIEKIPGVGTNYAKKLSKLNIQTVEDLIYHFPFRYDDFSQISTIDNLELDKKISIQGVLWQIGNIRTRSGKFLTVATVADQSGTIEVIWFNQPYLTKTLKAGLHISISGKIQLDKGKAKMISPVFEIIKTSNLQKKSTLHTGRLVPIYPETEGLSSKWIRGKLSSILPLYLKAYKDYLPVKTLKKYGFQNLPWVLSKIHLPTNYDEVEQARKRLAFDEIFLIQIMSLLRQREWQEQMRAPKMKINNVSLRKFIKSLPFSLTNAQDKAISTLTNDLQNDTPSNRLLEGDVGSGKTVVATAASLMSHENGYEILFAAPTEILAFQHQNTLKDLLKPFNIKVGIWTGNKKQKGDVTCGTHALLSTYKSSGQVGLVIVDEQHRFGVAQRAKLFMDQKTKLTPHLLTMTATPIPRTLALTLYGDLNLSVLDEMPKGRQKISTFVVPNNKRQDAYRFIETEVSKGKQAFILTPFVEPSESMQSVKAATVEFDKLKSKFSSKIKLGLLHGKLKSKDSESEIEVSAGEPWN